MMKVPKFAFILCMAIVLQVVSCIEAGQESLSANLPVCAEGCIEGACRADYVVPGPPSPEANTPFLQELTTDCTPAGTDARGRPNRYLCFEVVETFVTYDGDSDRPATISQTELIEARTIEQTVLCQLGWDGAHLIHEEISVTHDGVDTGASLSWDWHYEGDLLLEIEARTQFPEDNGPEEAGNHSQAVFSDGNVERAHAIDRWDAAGLIQRQEVRAGVDDVLFSETDYRWSPEGKLLGLTSRRETGNPDDRQDGCESPSPGIIVCEATLEYDAEGTLVGVSEAGNNSIVSDSCCGRCIPAG
jgi:hypothetical protein